MPETKLVSVDKLKQALGGEFELTEFEDGTVMVTFLDTDGAIYRQQDADEHTALSTLAAYLKRTP